MNSGAPLSKTSTTPPFAPFEWMLAMRYLRARRKEGFISVIAGISFIGIMLGVATLIIVMSVMNGFRQELFSTIVGLDGHAIVAKVREAGPFEDYQEAAARVRKAPGVTTVIPLIDGQVLLSSPVQSFGGFVRGVTAEGLRSMPLVAKNIIGGIPEGFDTGDGIIIGTRMANDLRVGIGQSLTLIAPRGAQTPFGTAPRTKSYTVIAFFEVGMSLYDRQGIFMPLAEAQRYFSKGKEVDYLEVMIDVPEAVEERTAAIKAAAGEDYLIDTWRRRHKKFFDVLEVERSVMFIVLSLIVLVAALNIISGLMMLVKDKGRDIAVLRTMGATRGAMMRVFLITGAAIGVVGTIAGLIIGLIFCANIEAIRQFVQWATSRQVFDPSVYYLAKLPAQIDWRETIFIVVMALTLSVLATIYPSWRAAKLDPVEALRYE
jgi:lipoprotein-releasing system permease protein